MTSQIDSACARLTATVEAMIAWYGDLPLAALVPADPRAWGAKEVLIHLVFWHEQYAGILAALVRGATPALLPGTFRSHNTRAAERDRDVAVEELIQRWQDAHLRLCALARTPGAASLTMSFKEGSRPWPLLEALTRIEQHVRNHLTALRSRIHVTHQGASP